MRAARSAVAGAAIVATLALASCGLPGSGAGDPDVSRATAVPASPRPTPTGSPTGSPTRARPIPSAVVDRPMVLVVSVDGFNPAALRDLGPASTPGFERLRSEGVSTLDARTSLEQTHTLPNHTGMLTGLPVAGSTGHGTTMNEDDGSTLESRTGRYLPGMFDRAHDAGLSTSMYVGKTKFRFLSRSWDGEHGAADTTGRDDGRDKVDREEIRSSEQLVDDVIADLTGDDPTRLTFLHLPLTDTVGHRDGFMSARYLRAVLTVDGLVARLLDAVDRDPELARRLTVVLTADHGGRGPNHDDADSPDNYTIPFFVWGPGAAPGADLYDVNPGRRDPGDGRPGYDGPQPVRNMDVADLALSLLRLDPLPNSFGSGPEGLLRIR